MIELSIFVWISIFTIGVMLVNSAGNWAIYKNSE